MKIILTIILVILAGCDVPAASPVAPQPPADIPNYAVIGKYQMGGTSVPAFQYYVIVDKTLDKNKAGFRSIVSVLCGTAADCQVIFWDNKNKAAYTRNVTDAQANASVAIYNRYPGAEDLSVCGLNEC